MLLMSVFKPEGNSCLLMNKSSEGFCSTGIHHSVIPPNHKSTSNLNSVAGPFRQQLGISCTNQSLLLPLCKQDSISIFFLRLVLSLCERQSYREEQSQLEVFHQLVHSSNCTQPEVQSEISS